MKNVNKILYSSLFKSHMVELNKLEKERIFCKHGMEHLLSVARIMRIKALEQGLLIEPEIIYSAALLHDIGRGASYKKGTDHAKESAEIAKQILTDCDFNESDREKILYAVLHHNDDAKADELCRLLRTADKLSRNCFDCSAYNECNWCDSRKNKEVVV